MSPTTNDEETLRHVNGLLDQWTALDKAAAANEAVSLSQVAEVVSAMGGAIERLAPADSVYRREARRALAQGPPVYWPTAAALAGILSALRKDYESGALEDPKNAGRIEALRQLLATAGELSRSGEINSAVTLVNAVVDLYMRSRGERQVASSGDQADVALRSLRQTGALDPIDFQVLQSWEAFRSRVLQDEKAATRSELDDQLESLGSMITKGTAR